MKKLTTDQSKIDLVAKLVKEGHIDFVDAIKLLEVETEKEFVYYPYNQPTPIQPYPAWPTMVYQDNTIPFTYTAQ